MSGACYSCRQNAVDAAELPGREQVYDDGHWRVAHAFNSALPGWLVVVARRHLTSLGQLTAEEATALGPLLRACSGALEQALGAQKAYVLFLAEAQGFKHLHIHVVPRMPDLPYEQRAVRVFYYLDRPESEWISPQEMDRLAAELRPLIQARLEDRPA